MSDPHEIALPRFFMGKPGELALYRAFTAKVLAALPETKIRVLKSQIAFSNKYNFAFASLPIHRRKGWPEHCLIISFGLSYRLDSPRIAVSVEPYPRRWTHHVLIVDERELDEELMGWVKEAYAFSAGKR